jgi:hypothetical protein
MQNENNRKSELAIPLCQATNDSKLLIVILLDINGQLFLVNIVMSFAAPTLGLMGFTDCLRAVIAALEPPRFALQPSGCHHGPWAVR